MMVILLGLILAVGTFQGGRARQFPSFNGILNYTLGISYVFVNWIVALKFSLLALILSSLLDKFWVLLHPRYFAPRYFPREQEPEPTPVEVDLCIGWLIAQQQMACIGVTSPMGGWNGPMLMPLGRR